MCYLGCQKIIEGSIFRGRDSIQNLLSDLDLGGPDDLRYDLRGRLRPLEAKIVFSQKFLNRRKIVLAIVCDRVFNDFESSRICILQ